MSDSQRPTVRAESNYTQARDLLNTIWAMKGRNEIEIMSFLAGFARAQRYSSMGDIDIATALRATYIKLEEIDKKLTRIEISKK